MTTPERLRKAYRKARADSPRGRASVALNTARERLAKVAATEAAYKAANPQTGNPEARGALPIDGAGGHEARAAYCTARFNAGLFSFDGPIKRHPPATMSEDKTAIHVGPADGAGVFDRLDNAKAHWAGAASWFDNPHGESSRDGSGLCWGVVALLTHGRALAGWQFGSVDSGPTLATRIFSGPDYLAEAARYADGLAERAAEAERDYREAWQAGARWAELGGRITEARAEALQLARERRALSAMVRPEAVAASCRAIRGKVSAAWREICEARAERAQLAESFDHCEGWADGADT